MAGWGCGGVACVSDVLGGCMGPDTERGREGLHANGCRAMAV